MKVTTRTLLVTLLTCSTGFYAAAGFTGDDSATQPPEQAVAPLTETATEATATETPAPVTEPAPVATPTETPEPAGEDAVEEPAMTEYPLLPPVEGADAAKSTPQGTKAPVTGAFGIPLGEGFADWMVAKVISQEEAKYRSRGEEKTEYTGTQYQVEPNVPNLYFNEYLVKTNKDGIIYSITGKQSSPEKANACEKTKEIAIFLMDKYGKPRGRGILGEWFAFRESVEGPYKGIRFYAQRCRNGRYSVVYSDDGAMMREAAPAQTDVMKGL